MSIFACHSGGVVRWTAQYMLIRGMGRVHIFPGDDVGVRKNLHSWVRLAVSPDYEKRLSIVLRWELYSGMVHFHFLLSLLKQKDIPHEE